MSNQKLTFEVNAKDVNIDQVRKKIQGIDKEILSLQQHAKEIRISDKGNTEIGKKLVESINNAITELKGVKQQYDGIIDNISKKKIDTKEFDNFTKEINNRIESIEQRISGLEESLTKVSSLFSKKISTNVLQGQIEGLETKFKDFTESIKPAMESLKAFNDLVASTEKSKEIKLKVDSKELNKVENLYEKLNSDNILGGKSGLKINTATAAKQLTELYDKYNILSKQLDKSKDPKEITRLQIELAELLPELAKVSNRIIELKKINIDDLFGGTAGKISVGNISDFTKIFDFIDTEIGKTSVKMGAIKKEMQDAVEETVEGATTEVSSFTFKKGGIRIPVTIDASSKTALETKYKQIISTLQEYADVHPVNVTMRLFPLNTNRADASEITNELRRIQTDINNVDDEELKTKLNSLYDDLEAQFKKALNLKIKVDLGETEASARQRIKELQDTVKAEGFTIYPTFDISEADSKAITDKLNEIQKKATINLNKELQDTARAIDKLINGGDIDKWSSKFAASMDTVYQKLEKLQPFINSLANFFANAKLSNNDLISSNDVRNITNLSNSINLLKGSIEKVEKLDLSKVDTENFISKIQQNIDGNNPIQIPIEPDLSGISSFISKIENAIESTGLNIQLSNSVLPQKSNNNLKDVLQDKDNANKLYLDIYNGLDKVAENIGSPLKKKIAGSLVVGLRQGMSDTSQILREGLKGTQFESITEQIIGDTESLDTIKRVANEAVTAFSKVSNGISQEGENAKVAADYKREFVEANKQVAESAEKTADATKEAANGIAQEGNVADKNNLLSGTTLSKKEVVEQLISELNLTKKAAEDLFKEQGYSKTNNKYQIEQQAVDELIASIKEKKQLENQDVNDATEKSAELTTEEAQAMANLDVEANKAAEAKKQFIEANQQVLSSIIESLKGLNSEGEGFANLNKLINNLGGKKGEEKVTQTVEGLKQIYEVLNQDISDNALINSLNELASKGTDLENLATVLKSTKKEINNAQDALKDAGQDKLEDIMESIDVSGNAKGFLSQYGEVVNITQEIKKGFIQITSTVLGADDVFRRYTLTTKNGVDMVISKQEEHTTALEKEIAIYSKLLKVSQSLNKVNPNQTDEIFIEKDSALWSEIISYAKEYGDDLGNILSITRSVRQVNDELLESFKIVGEKGSVTIGAENDVVASVQNLGNITTQLKQLASVQKSLQGISDDRNKGYTEDYLNQVRSMISLIESSEFDITNPDDITRLEKMIADANELKQAAKDTDNILGNTNSLEKIRQKISDILNDYQAMPHSLKVQFEELRELSKNLIDTGATKKQVDEVNSQFLTLNANLSESGRKYQGMFAQMLQRLRSESSQLLARYFSFQDILRYARTAVSALIDLDTQLVDLRKTTSMTTSELNQFYNASSDVAKELGVTTSEIISQASAWSRLGYSTKEASTEMAKLSSKFASVSPGMTTENATDYLVSTMQAYGIAVDDVERKVMDNVNRIGNTFATTNAEIGEMLTRSSAAMNAANNSLEETIALESAAVEVTRNAELTGTAFRTVSMRIRGLDEETEEALEDYEELKGKIADLTKTKDTPGGVSLFTDATKTEYKSTYQFLKDIAAVYDQISDKNQAALLEAIGGKRGAQSLAPILSNFKEVERAMKEMEGAAGSADKEMDIIRDKHNCLYVQRCA